MFSFFSFFYASYPVRSHEPTCACCKWWFLLFLLSATSFGWLRLVYTFEGERRHLTIHLRHLMWCQQFTNWSFSKTEVANLDETILINEDILRFKVSVNHLMGMNTVQSLNNLIKKFIVLIPVRLGSAFNYGLKGILRAIFHLDVQVHWYVLLVLHMESDNWMSWVEGTSCGFVSRWGLFAVALLVIAFTIAAIAFVTVYFWVLSSWVVGVVLGNTWQSLLLLSKLRNLCLFFLTFLNR